MNRINPHYANHGPDLTDYGPEPFVENIERAAKQNSNYRAALWTGLHLQLTLMSIPVGGDIGLESHPHLDQFLRIEDGFGLVKMGACKDKLNYQKDVCGGYAVFVPAGTWHNLVNTGNRPIKLYSIYAPPQHPHGTLQSTKQEAEHGEQHVYIVNNGAMMQNEYAKPEKPMGHEPYEECDGCGNCGEHGECDNCTPSCECGG